MTDHDDIDAAVLHYVNTTSHRSGCITTPAELAAIHGITQRQAAQSLGRLLAVKAITRTTATTPARYGYPACTDTIYRTP